MKRLLYKLFFILLFFNVSVFAQKKILYNDQIDIKKATEISLDIKKIPLTIIESLDSKIHIDFSMKFKNHSEKEINSYKKKLKIVKEVLGETIKLTIGSSSKTSLVEYKLSRDFDLEIPDIDIQWENTQEGKRKTKKQIVNQIFEKELKEQSFGLALKKAIKKDKKAQIREAYFILRLPKHLKIKIDAEEASLIFEGIDITNADITMTKGSCKARRVVNSKLNLKDTQFNVAELVEGNIKLINASKSSIGSIQDTHLETESSVVEIGEIKERVVIQDFNSKLFLNNFSPDFKKFELKGEYSKIYFFEPKHDYGMSAIGHNTTFHFDNNTVNSQPSKENKKSKMMDKKPKTKNYSGDIKFDIIHSIFYYPTTIKINKNTP